jgi:membrane protease YdiL (CAAX protease family)
VSVDPAKDGPSVTALLAMVALGLAVAVPLLVGVRRLLPRLSVPRPAWRPRELGMVLLTWFLALPVLWLGAGGGVVRAIYLTQVQLGITAWVALELARRRSQGVAALGLVRRPRVRELAGAVIVHPALFWTLAGVGGLWSLLLERLGRPAQQEIMELLLDLDTTSLLLAAPAVVLVGPFLEEFLFRGFLQGVLAARLGDRVAIAISSLLFAILHGLAPLPMLLGLALYLGWLQARTRSVLVPFAVHALHNAITLGLALVAPTLLGS